MPPSVVLAIALRILSETGTPVGHPVQLVAPGDFPSIEARIAPLRAFRRRIDGVLDPVIYVLRTTQMFERAAAGHAPSAVLVAGSIFHEQLHGTDDAVDEAHVLIREAAFLQRHRPDGPSPEHGRPAATCLPVTLRAYVTGMLPVRDRRGLAIPDRRGLFRGGRRSWDRHLVRQVH